jgi:hypothetical protein
MRKLSTRLGLAIGLAVAMSSSASATAILKFSLGDTGPDIAYSNGVFSTVNDGDAATPGDQDTSVRFVGPLAFMTDILSGASFSLANVTASGLAIVTSGVITQLTTGGQFALYDQSNSLLLAGTLDSGVISGGLASSTGSFFNSTAGTFTGGSLLSYIAPTPAGLSIALSDILSNSGLVGMAVTPGCIVQCQLGNFTAAADQLVDGSPVPEPATALLFTSGVVGAFIKRRRTQSNLAQA